MMYRNFSKRQLLAMTWWNRPEFADFEGIICEGSIRSGKTLSMAVGFVLWSMTRFDNQVFGIAGRTVGALRRNVISHMSEWLEGLFTIEERISDNRIVISCGARKNTYYLFGGFDEGSYKLVQGITLAGALLDEVALMPRSFVEQLEGRCSVEGSKWWYNCNPEGPQHWFLLERVKPAAERKLLRLHFTMDDNLSLAPSIKARYEAMYSGVFYQRYIQGLWTKAEGLVYPMFDRARHVKEPEPATLRARYYVSCDYGTLNPCAFGLWRLDQGAAVMIREYYYDGRKRQRQKTDEEYYEDLVNFVGQTPIQQIIIDPSAASFRATIRKHGRFSVRDAKNDVLDGIRFTATLLQSGVITFSPSCRETIAEFGAYAWDEKQQKDAVIKENDHSMDQMRYFAFTILRREVNAGGK